MGFINPLLYARSTPAGVLHEVTSGNNDIYNDLDGEFAAGPGWDACTGLGLIDGAKLLAGATRTAASCTAGCAIPSARSAKALGLRLSLV